MAIFRTCLLFLRLKIDFASEGHRLRRNIERSTWPDKCPKPFNGVVIRKIVVSDNFLNPTRTWQTVAVFDHGLHMQLNGFTCHSVGVDHVISMRNTSGKIGDDHAKPLDTFFAVDVDRIIHFRNLFAGRPFPACLLEDRFQRRGGQILLRMRHGDFARLVGMLELVVAANDFDLAPTVCTKAFDDVAAAHSA